MRIHDDDDDDDDGDDDDEYDVLPTQKYTVVLCLRNLLQSKHFPYRTIPRFLVCTENTGGKIYFRARYLFPLAFFWLQQRLVLKPQVQMGP